MHKKKCDVTSPAVPIRAHLYCCTCVSVSVAPPFLNGVMSQKAESKKEEFRKYLESAGVLDALTKVLVGLYEEPEKPGDPLAFLKEHLHGGQPEAVDTETLRRENEELQKRNRELEAKVAELTAALAKHGGGETAQEDAA